MKPVRPTLGACIAAALLSASFGALADATDVDGVPYVKHRMDLAKSKGTFWQDYKFTNPVTKKIEPKQMYCEKLDDTAVCGGIYK